MKLGFFGVNSGVLADPETMVAVARTAEAAGWESIWTGEHVVVADPQRPPSPVKPETHFVDQVASLAHLAAHTSTIRLATGILILPERNPLVLAKQLATMDQLTGGRVDLGIGVGWLREEFDALGIPWKRRGARTDEYVEIMRTLWSGDSVAFDGEFASFAGVSSNPKPVSGNVPIVVGGHTEAAARRAGRLGDGFWPGRGDLGYLIGIMRQEAEAHGRNPDGIEVTWAGDLATGENPVEAAEGLRALGVDRIVVPSFLFLRDTAGALAQFADAVVAPLADL